MHGWARLGKLQSLVQQDDIAKDIALCHQQITDCLDMFNVRDFCPVYAFPVLRHPQLTSQFEIHAWMTEFEANKRQDHAQLIKALSQVQEHQVIIEETTSSTNDLVQQMMVMLQKVLVHFQLVYICLLIHNAGHGRE